MASSKDLFLRNEEDVKAALAITKSDIFFKLLAYARAEFTQRNPTAEQSTGANNFISILADLPEENTEEPEWVQSGLKHDLSVPERTEPKQK